MSDKLLMNIMIHKVSIKTCVLLWTILTSPGKFQDSLISLDNLANVISPFQSHWRKVLHRPVEDLKIVISDK